MDRFEMYEPQAEGVRYHGTFFRLCTMTEVTLLSIAVEWFCPCNRFLYMSNSAVKKQPTNFLTVYPFISEGIWPRVPGYLSLRPIQSSYFHGVDFCV